MRFEILAASANDHIAKHLAKGAFYELEDLCLIRRHISRDATILDIGANIGNHTIFFDRVMGSERVIVFDVSDVAIQILLANIAINRLRSVDTRYLGLGLSDKTSQGNVFTHPTNLGLTSVSAVEDAKGTVDLVRGDDILAEELAIHLIKIDVEGGELDVLSGLGDTIARHRPAIFIEVSLEKEADFCRWANSAKYIIAERVKRYSENCNYLLLPR